MKEIITQIIVLQKIGKLANKKGCYMRILLSSGLTYKRSPRLYKYVIFVLLQKNTFTTDIPYIK